MSEKETKCMKFAIVTPSYSVDLERCSILSDSISQYVPGDVDHFVIVTRQDAGLFQAANMPRSKLILQDDVVPLAVRHVPGFNRWRWHWRTLPIRGWIWQQIVKLSIAEFVDADAYMMVDSDCLFVKPFDPRHLVDGYDRVPLFRQDEPFFATHPDTQQWHRYARRLLGIKRSSRPPTLGYVGPHVFWRRENLRKLADHLHADRSTGWISKISMCPTFSEYMLYGVFAEDFLGLQTAGHYVFQREIVENYWPEVPMSESQVKEFAAHIPTWKVMVHINGKSRTPVTYIRKAFGLTK